MRHILLLPLFCFFMLNTVVQANDDTLDSSVHNSVQTLQKQWAIIKYQTKGEDKQLSQFKALANQAQNLAEKSPQSAELKIWQAIIISTQAGVQGGMGALKLVKKARNLLLDAEKIDANALNGSIYTSLGSLYYQVPSWPIGFGNSSKARAYLNKALKINPQGIDSNFFYADFLVEQEQYSQALNVLETALAAPARPQRPIADKGRRDEIQQLIKKAQVLLAEEE